MSNLPDIRFKGFIDDWEQRKLGDISEIKTGPFGSTLHADDYVSDGIPIITTEHFKTGTLPIKKDGLPQVSENDFNRLSAYILNEGDIVFSRVGSVDINALITPFQNNWLFSGRVLRVRPQGENSSQFLHTLLETESVRSDIRTRAVGQTMPSINTEILKITPLFLPTSIAEQERLGEYFHNLDNLITLHQRKCDETRKLKQYMLQKMFPKKGEKIPEIRFQGFEGDWERRKLGECFDERTERSAEGELIAVTINSGVVKASELNRHDNSSEDKSNYKVVRVNDIAYNSMRMWQGASGYSQYDGILSPAYTVAIPKENVNPIFFSYMFKRTEMIHEFQINSQGLTSDTWNLKFPAFSKIVAIVPKSEEQQAIGNYFKSLDNLITLHQHKSAELKEMKNYMLQNMFPKGKKG